MMTEYELTIVFREGRQAFIDEFVVTKDNPYIGVSEILAEMWDEGYWYEWYAE